jgi:hypothetical protein
MSVLVQADSERVRQTVFWLIVLIEEISHGVSRADRTAAALNVPPAASLRASMKRWHAR